MAPNDLPAELAKGYWDKKKGAVPAGSALETQLKTFEKKHGAVDWSVFQPGWSAHAKTAAELDSARDAVDRAYRSKVLVLKAEAAAVGDAAQKLGKDKGLAKPTLDAIRTIAEAVKGFGKAVDDGLSEIDKAHEKASKALKSSSGSADEEDESDNSALLDPKRLLNQLTLLKRDPERRAGFAFLSDGKGEPMLSLSPKSTGKRLFSKLQAETSVKTGAYGRAWIADQVLFLEMEKPFSGLTKKVRAPLKAIGFRVAKVVLAAEDGGVAEADEEAEGGDATTTTASAAGASPATAPPPKVEPGVAFTQTRLVWDRTRKTVQDELRKLERSIIEACAAEPDAAQIAAGTKNLYDVLEVLDERLIDKLDEALNAATPGERQARHDEAREIVAEYVDFVATEPLMQDIDDNGFVPVAIKSHLVTSLKAIGDRLRA